MKYLFEFADYQSTGSTDRSFGILGDLGESSKFGEQTGYFERLLQKCSDLGMDAFVFTDFDQDGAVAWNKNGEEWVESRRALPTVFYDRSFITKKAADKTTNTRYLCDAGCTPINSADFRKIALDKHLMYEELVNEELEGLGLPKTEKFSKSGIIPFMKDRESCIIKPRFGSGGKGIIRVMRTPTGYELKYKDYSLTTSEALLPEKINEIREKLNTHNRLYIMQECIDLPKYNDSVFDVRVIYQRGKKGSPLRTGMAVRLAAPNKITANLHQGGERETLSHVLKVLFNQDINGPIAEAIRKYSKLIFKKLDKKAGPIGEIGIDFLIDQRGNIHLIEVNSLPGRSLFKILPEIREKSISRPVEYAQHLLNKKRR